jgi:hypothetical protein
MMSKLLPGCMIAASLFAAGAAHANCSVSSDPKAVARPLNMTVQADTNLIVAMTMLPKMLHIDYDSAGKKVGCDLGPLAAGDAAYDLWGDDGGQRKALPATKGAPVALIVPVFDLLKALTAPGKNKTAEVEGYLLAVVTKDEFTGWRYYTGMPDPAILKHDMADALAGKGNAIFRSSEDGKITLFTSG